ncbi:MAG: hypothetical protein JWN84_657 [Nocardioides sp.]|nr:hypothetical protein [Nocardioides sp.]
MKSRALALTTAGIVAATAVAASPVSAGSAAWALPDSPDSPDSTSVRVAARPTTSYAPVGAVTTDGLVTEMVRVGDELVARGYFTRIGRYVGAGLAVDATTGQRRPFPQLSDRMVSVAVPDGSGGFYAGGYFDKADAVRRDNLVHVLADGTVDPDFDIRVDGYVYALALTGSTLHVGGDFDRVNSQRRANLAAVDVTTGTVTAFAHRSAVVSELAAAPAAGDRPARLYVSDGGLVALDPATGALDTTFVPAVPRRPKYEIAVAGDRVLLGYNGVVALDADGAVDPGFATGGIGPRGDVQDEAVSSLTVDGDRLLVGGRFSTLGGGTGPLAAYDLATGDPDTAFAPAFSRGARVHDVAVVDDRLWVGGRFSSAGGRSAGNVAAIDAATGARLRVDEPVVDDTVNAVDVSGDTLAVGGQFAIVDPLAADGYARLDATTLEPVAAGRSNRPAFAELLVDAGVIHAVLRGGVTALAPRSGAVLPARSHRLPGLVAAAVGGGRLVVVQDTTPGHVFGTNVISVFSTRTGERLSRGTLRLPGYVTDVRLLGSTAVVSGSFKRVRPNGQQADLAVLKWSVRQKRVIGSFDPFLNGAVYDISDSGPLLVAGTFRAATYGTGNDEVHRGIARLDPKYGTASSEFGGAGTVRGSFDTVFLPFSPSLVGLSAGTSYTNPRTRYLDAATAVPRPDPTGGFGVDSREFVRLPGGRVAYVTVGTLDSFGTGGRTLIASTTL